MGELVNLGEWKDKSKNMVNRMRKIRERPKEPVETGVIKEFDDGANTEAYRIAKKILQFEPVKDLDATSVDRHRDTYPALSIPELVYKLEGNDEEGWALNPIHFRIIAEMYLEEIGRLRKLNNVLR